LVCFIYFNLFLKKINFSKHSGGCDKTLEAMKTGRVAALLRPPESEIKHQKLENDDLDSYDYDLIVIGGGSGGLACSKVFLINKKRILLKKIFFIDNRKLDYLIKKFVYLILLNQHQLELHGVCFLNKN